MGKLFHWFFCEQPFSGRLRTRRRCLRIERLDCRRLLAGLPIITEFMASNGSTVTDGDGEYPDWIEVYNAGDEAVDLAGYRLTDKADNLNRWRFPSYSLESGEYLVVFASGKDSDNYVDAAGKLHTSFSLKAGGEYLALISPAGEVLSEFGTRDEFYPRQLEDTSYGIAQQATLVSEDSPSSYVIPLNDSLGTHWTEPGFDALDNGFVTGTSAIGFESRPDDRTNFSDQIQTTLPERTHAVFIRTEFQVGRATDIQRLLLRMKFDNGFVAYLNGTEVARQHAPDTLNWFTTSPDHARRDSDALEFAGFDISQHLGVLVDGQNVLAIHGLNSWLDDRDMLIVPELIAVANPTSGGQKSGYLASATPGDVNVRDTDVFSGIVSEVQFSASRGFYEQATEVTLTTDTPEALIRFTIDGSPPTEESGMVYSGPIIVEQTTILRAAAFTPDFLSSGVKTHTYLFLDDVLLQDSTPPDGFPRSWGAGVTDWGMDQDAYDLKQIAGDANFTLEEAQSVIKDSLLSLPTLSLVSDRDSWFGSRDGIYNHPQQGGPDWERATSVELIDPEDGEQNFQVDAGVRIQGFTSRDPNRNPKHSLRLVFRREYGDTKLRYPFFGDGAADEFDTLVLRSNSQDAWVYDAASNRDGQFIRDQWARETQLAMGQPSPHGNWVHLYINGLYWGLYNPTERPDASFNASYFEGDKNDYDSLKNHEEVIDGTEDAYRDLLALIQRNPRRFSAGYRDLSSDEAYQRVLGNNPDGTPAADLPRYIDEVNLIDYVIHNMYAAANDWPGNNYIGRERGADSDGFRFFDWDNEHGMKPAVTTNRTLPHGRDADSPTKFHHALRANAEYQMLFADRLHRDFFNGGPLYVDPNNSDWDPEHPERNVPAARWMALTREIEEALIAEATRWGDVRGIQYTPHDQFQKLRNRLLTNWFPRRSEIVLDQFRRQQLYPDVVAPSFSQHGGVITATTSIEISAPGGTVYFTTNGSDPRLMGGAVSPDARVYSDAIQLTENATLKSRVLLDGQWSALNEADFVIQSTLPLRITEINYHPHRANLLPGLNESTVDNDRFEFIELTNIGDQTIDLKDVTLRKELGEGIQPVLLFRFEAQQLAPNERLVIVRDKAAFQSRYGDSIWIALGNDGKGGPNGQHRGKLDNSGASWELIDANGAVIQKLRYADDGPWARRAGGGGSSLELVDADADPRSPTSWRSSIDFGGSPGKASRVDVPVLLINEILPNASAMSGDMIELYNPTENSIDIGNWYFSNSSQAYFRWQVPLDIVVPANGYGTLIGADLGFELDGIHGDELWLVSASSDGRPLHFVDHAPFDSIAEGISLGPWEDVNGDVLFLPLSESTFGAANSDILISDVVISEVHFAPLDPDGAGRLKAADFEFVEIYNQSKTTIELTGWQLTGGARFTFSRGTRIDAGEVLVVVPFDPLVGTQSSVFRFSTGMDLAATLLGPYDGDLANDGDHIELQQPLQPANGSLEMLFFTVDVVQFEVTSPWPDGTRAGKSLDRLVPIGFGNLPSSWTASPLNPGRIVRIERLPGDSNEDGVFNELDVVQVLRAARYGTGQHATWDEGDWNGDGFFDQLDLVFALQTGVFF